MASAGVTKLTPALPTTPHSSLLLLRFMRFNHLLPPLALTLILAAGLASHTSHAENTPPTEQNPSALNALAEAASFARSGAINLALAQLNQLQAASISSTDTWLQIERTRLEIYQQQGMWPELTRRYRQLPDDLPTDFSRWASTEYAVALIELGEVSAARDTLLRLIWSGSQGLDENLFSRWRALLIQSYLREDNREDAHIALRRFEQDYGASYRDTAQLYTRLWLVEDKPKQALRYLDGPQSGSGSEPNATALALLAQLRSKQSLPEVVLKRALQQLQDHNIHAPSQHAALALLWLVIAEAAQSSGDDLRYLDALEQLLGLRRNGRPTDLLVHTTPEQLWQAYLDSAQRVSNQAQLLIGSYEPWYALAESLLHEKPQHARALLVELILNKAVNENLMRRAEKLFFRSLGSAANGRQILNALYLNSERYPNPEALPPTVLHGLIQLALNSADIALAFRLAGDFQRTPEDANIIDWKILQTRLLIVAKQSEQAAILLDALVQQQEQLDKNQLNDLYVAIGDLRASGKRDDSIALYHTLVRGKLPATLRHNLLFVLGELHESKADYRQAARFYLRASEQTPPSSSEQYSAAIRQRAAKMLGMGGYKNDARALYRALMEGTHDAQERTLLQSEFQQLGYLP
ncbi:MAG: hypothetical protein GXP10_06845 [Gammaproteobacteria bacterium]|nr:hypothetical protein [Gammaproteobacteria bacterium]